MASTVKCFICGGFGNYDLKVCNDNKRHRICGSCYDLCQDNYIVILDNGVAGTIKAHETWITIKITEINNCSKVLLDVDLGVKTAEIENNLQGFVRRTLSCFFDQEHNSPDVHIKVFTWQNYRFQCPVYDIDHMDMIDGYRWYAQEYVKKYFVDCAINSPSMSFGSVKQGKDGLGFQAENMLKNTKDMPFIWYYAKGVYLSMFVECYNLAVENYRIYKTLDDAISFSMATPPKKVRTEQGKIMASLATAGEEIAFIDNRTEVTGIFLRDESIQGGVVVGLPSGNVIGVHYHNIIRIAPKQLTHHERVAVNKELVTTAKPGDIVTHWQGGQQVKSSFISANDTYVLATSSFGGTETIGYLHIISIEPGTPDNTFEDDKITPDSTEQIADLEALTPEVHTHQLLSLPGYPATEDDEGENIPVKTFKSGKSKQIAEQIRQNALKNTSRFLALLVVGFLACCLAGVINSGVTHAQTACTVHKYAHKAGYYQRGYGTTTFYATPPSGCTVYNGPSDNTSSVVSTSTPVSTQTSTSTPSTTKHAKKSSQGHRKHTSKKQHASIVSTHQSCKYTFDNSDTGTHKRSCNGTEVIIKITD